jgi:hypothetical protein
MNVDQIRRAQDRLAQAQDEVTRWEARLSELDELSAEGPGRALLRERRVAEAELRASSARLRDAKRTLLHLRVMRPRRADGRHAA